jgi:hypothetical protein
VAQVNAPLDVYVFRDPHFSPSGDTLVCIAERRRLERFMTRQEIAHAFSGCATYRGSDGGGSWLSHWLRSSYVGVWGRKNTSRFRRFLRERGAELTIHRGAPSQIRLAYYTTDNARRQVRELPPRPG